MKRLLIGMLILTIPFLVSTVEASDSNIPEVNAYQDNNHVKVEWAVEMIDSDVLYETGFETEDLLPNLTYSSSNRYLDEHRWYGGQSFTGEDKYSGQRSLRVEDSYSNSNIYSNALDGTTILGRTDSWADFKDSRFTVPNSTDLSLSFRAKTNNAGEISFTGTGGAADYGSPIPDVIFTNDVNIGDRTVKVNNISTFKSAVDRGSRFHIALSKGRYSYGHVVSYNQANSTITLSTGFKGKFSAGEDVLRHNHRSPVSFSSRQVNASDGWKLFNVNTKIANYADYNTLVRGFYLTIRTGTRDVVYIDDVKVGYATNAELHRDGVQIYEGRLSDYEDKEATDKAKPSKVSKYTLHHDDGRTYMKLTEPDDNGTTYNYIVKSVSKRNGAEYTSENQAVNVVSGIKGYSYIIDNNKSTKPSGAVNSVDTEIEIPNSVSKDSYLHVQAVDNEGNRSEVTHIALDEIDRTPPTAHLENTPVDWVRNSITFKLIVNDESGIYKISGPKNEDLIVNSRGELTYTAEENGEYVFIITDNAGNKVEFVVVIDKIDKSLPILTLLKNIIEWTNESVVITATATDGESGVDSIYLNNDNEDLNLVSMRDLMRWHSESYEINGMKVSIASKLNTHYGGLYVPQDLFEANEDYILSFDMRKLSGEIPVIGGHLLTASEAEVFIDGIKMSSVVNSDLYNDWYYGINYPNDNYKHNVVVKFNTDELDVDHQEKGFYIQPNRRLYKDNYKVEIDNIMLHKGTDVLTYEPNSKDLIDGDNPLTFAAQSNGVYEFAVIDNAGNIATQSVTVDNIDKSSPNVTVTQSTTDVTHDNVTLNVNAVDNDSGIKSVMYIGENMVKNGDFSDGFNHWEKVGGIDDIEFSDGIATFDDNPRIADKFTQRDAFKESALGTRYYAEIRARGEGTLNARYGVSGGGGSQRDYSQLVNSGTFETYRFVMDRNRNNNGNLVIEKIGLGHLEIAEIKVFEQSDITESRKLEVMTNGNYTFVVDDNANNITRITHVVDNIDKTMSMTGPSIGTLDNIALQGGTQTYGLDVSPIKVEDWRDNTNQWEVNVSATQLKMVGKNHSLPKGTLSLKPLTTISRVIGAGSMPTKSFSYPTVIDSGSIELANSLNSRGEYDLTFPSNALEVTIDSSLAKLGEYETTITWELINAP